MNKSRVNSKDAVIYCRTATAPQSDISSDIAAQEEACSDYAHRAGFHVVNVFIDDGCAASSAQKPGLEAMLAYLENIELDNANLTVISVDRSRFGRNPSDYLRAQDRILRAGGRIEFIDGSAASDTAEEAFISSMLVARAEYLSAMEEDDAA